MIRSARGVRQALDASGADGGEFVQQLIMDQAVGGQYLAAVQVKGSAGHVGYDPARLFDQQDPCRSVPWIEFEFPKGIDSTGGDAAKIESGGACTAHSVRAKSDLVIVVNIRVLVPLMAGEASGYQALNQLFCL